MMTSTARHVCSAILLALAMEATLHSQAKDVVELTDGNRITGEVRRLERGQLSFHTGPTGTISIAWTDVVTLSSVQELDIELTSGVEHVGTITSPSPGHLVVQTASGATPPIDLKSIVRMIPIAATWRARTTGSIDFGANLTKSGDARTYTLAATADNRTRSYETETSFNSWLQASSDADTLTRNDFKVSVRRFLHQRWFAVGKFAIQQDDELDLDWRVLAGGGIGRKLVQSNAMLLSVEGGLDYNGESYHDEAGSDHSAELFAGVDWDYFSPRWSTDTTVVATTFISLARQRARLEIDARLRRDIFWSLYWSVNLFDSFDSDPPGDRERSNFGAAFTLGWSF